MAIRKKPQFKKRNFRRKTTFRKKKLIPKAMLPHYFVRRTSGTIESLENLDLGSTNATASAVYKAYESKLDQLSNYTELTALFDNYRITAVKYEFVWNMSSSAGATTSNIYTPSLNYFFDYDDSTTPTDDEFRERKIRSIRLSPMRNHVVVDKRPSVATEIYTGGLSAYSQKVSPKLDCAYPSVPHYGLKVQVVKPP